MKTKITKPVMRYHGAKFRLAPWIMSFFPEHHTYVEPFGGAAGVLLQKMRSQSEVYNDLDGDVSNVFTVLRDEKKSARLQRLLLLTPYSRHEFDNAYTFTSDSIERARRTIIRAHMGFGGGGLRKHKTGFRLDSVRKYGTAAQLWAEYPEQISIFCQRLRGVLIENRPALKVIENHDREDSLFFIDPPYPLETRTGGERYRCEMTDADHEELLAGLVKAQGMVVLSGYDNDLYNDILHGWEKHSTLARIAASRGCGIRTENVWLNPAVQKTKKQRRLFA